MRVTNQHRLQHAEQHASPYCDVRPDPEDVALLVIHGISLPPGEYGGDLITRLFTDHLPDDLPPRLQELRDLKVSSHLLISRTGEIQQFVPFHLRAWHAGESVWRGRPGCNDFAVGIELEGCDDEAYTDDQYKALVAASRALMIKYPRLGLDTVVGHSEIAPGRKTDPGGAFDWGRFLRGLGKPE